MRVRENGIDDGEYAVRVDRGGQSWYEGASTLERGSRIERELLLAKAKQDFRFEQPDETESRVLAFLVLLVVFASASCA